MKPQDIFGLAIRILGLVFLYHLATALPALLPMMTFSAFNLVFGAILIIVALFLIRWLISGAPHLMRLAYPDSKNEGGEQK